jgi:hypothetical protein
MIPVLKVMTRLRFHVRRLASALSASDAALASSGERMAPIRPASDVGEVIARPSDGRKFRLYASLRAIS